MSCAALSIRAVRMAERGMDTRSETDESGGLSLSAAEEDKGQSSRQRDTMESTITCNGHQRSVTEPSVTDHGVERGSQTYLKFLVSSFGEFTSQRVQSLPHRPVHRQHMGQLTQWRVQLRGKKCIQMSVWQHWKYYACVFQLTAREFLASFSTCLAAWISSISPAPRNTHTCCWTRTQRRSITLETDRRGSVMSAEHA